MGIICDENEITSLYVLCRVFKKYDKDELKNHIFGAYTSLKTASKAARKLMETFDNGCKLNLKTPGVFYILEYPIGEINNVFVPINKEVLSND